MDPDKPALPRHAPSPALLAEFRQRAEAILAHERGFTPACLVKLRGVARQLGFAEDQIDDALRTLGAGVIPPPAPPNPQVEKFRRRLTKDLQGKSRSILGPTIEARIVEAAQRKYSISDATARDVFAQVAAELGLRRISADEAVRSLTASIDQAAADSTWLAKESRDRLRAAGLNWGMELEVVDELIEEKLQSNRLDRDQRRYWNRTVLYCAGGGVALVAIVLAALALGTKPKPATISPDPLQSQSAPAPSAAAPVMPAWWDVDLTLAIAKARNQVEGFLPVYEKLISPNASDRLTGYQQLLELARRTTSVAQRDLLADVIAACYALEPNNECAGQLAKSLVAMIPAVEAPLPKNLADYDLAYWAGRTALKSFSRPGLPDQRRDALAILLTDATSGFFDRNQAGEAAEKAIAAGITTRLYQQVTAAAAREPAGVTSLERFVAARAQSHLSAEETARLEANFLAAALSAPRVAWRDYQEMIAASAASPDPLIVLKLLEVYEHTADSSLRDFLAELLLRRVDAKSVPGASVRDVARTVRQALGAAESHASSARDRWLRLRDRVNAALARPAPAADDYARLLAQSAELANLGTLACALSQGDVGLVVFDDLLRLEVAAKEDAANPGTTHGDVYDVPDVKGPARPLTAAERQLFDRLMAQFDNFAALPSVQRESNARALALLADALPDLTVRHAEAVAKYVLAEKEETEQASLMKPLSEVRRWKQLRLAIADGLERAQPSAELCEQLSVALLETEHSTPESLSSALKRTVLDDLQTSADSTRAASKKQRLPAEIDRAAEALLEAYRARARVLGVAAAEYQAAESPSQALQLGAASLARQLSGSSSSEEFPLDGRLVRELTVADYLAANDLQRTAALQHVSLNLLAQRVSAARPDRSSKIAGIVAKTDAAFLSAANCLAQLHASEAGQLRLWMLMEAE